MEEKKMKRKETDQEEKKSIKTTSVDDMKRRRNWWGRVLWKTEDIHSMTVLKWTHNEMWVALSLTLENSRKQEKDQTGENAMQHRGERGP